MPNKQQKQKAGKLVFSRNLVTVGERERGKIREGDHHYNDKGK